MKAVELAVFQKGCWRKIAIALIDPGLRGAGQGAHAQRAQKVVRISPFKAIW
jgi:hypothetical protein